jgi:DNA helicase II / ATP-dependent DNA helicase PcrA
MKTAVYQKQIIHLEQNQKDWQKLFDEGRKGNLTCPSCGEKVRLYLGIESPPRFIHTFSINPACKDPIVETHNQQTNNSIEYIERNGFRLPKSRSIQTVQSDEQTYKPIELIKPLTPFMPDHQKTPMGNIPYLKALQDAGIFLDENQAKAVTNTEGPLLVVAGAGSGKTRVLTARAAYMIAEKKIDPKSIMLVTFTAKAAAEMKNRLLRYPKIRKQDIQQLVVGTFHSIFFRILSFHSPEKWSLEKLLKKEWQREQILKEAGRNLQIDDKEFAFDLALQQISNWKNTLLGPKDVRPESEWEEKVLLLYEMYESSKQANGLFDFDDMLIGCFQLFQEDKGILDFYQNRFRYFLIDEFQDVNKIQYELIKLLSLKTKNVCAVGDDDQAIYAFRGSDPDYLLYFENDFPNASQVILNQNYRSSHEIISLANAIISKNKKRRPKEMKAQYSQNQLPGLFFPYDEEQEATMIVTDLQEKIAAGAAPEDFAILYRTHTAGRAIFERLANSSLPFRIDQDAESFYERFLIKGLLAYLQLSLDEDDQSAINMVLPSLFIKQSALRDIKAESILNDRTLLESLSKLKTGYAFQENKLRKLVPVVRSLSSLSPLRAIETIENEIGYQDFVKKRGGEGNKWDKGSEEIRDLKVVAKEFATIREFLEHANHMTAMNKEMKRMSREHSKGITLSTIHRAKGLEYPTVYVIGAVDGSLPHDYALEAYRNGDPNPLEEERRLLYVAITRAKENLYISVPMNRRGKKANPSRFLPVTR